MWQGSYTFSMNQWGVGHGGLHSQSIRFQALHRGPTLVAGDESVVRFIFDCGSGRTSRPRLPFDAAVGQMLNDVPDESTIDLLAISHFDRDHVNGLEHLSAEFHRRNIRVDRVWAPVLTPIEAMFAITTARLSATARQSYAELLGDPVSRLTQLFEGPEITQVPANDEPIPLTPVGATVDDIDISTVTTAATPDGRGLVARSGSGSFGEMLWEFQPYAVESTLVGARSVNARMRTLLGHALDQWSVDDLVTVSSDASLIREFHDAVSKHHAAAKKSARTSSARTGANLSSLCVYSGPVSPYDWCHFRQGWAPVHLEPRSIPIAPAWFGTGDAGLLQANHVDAMRAALTQSRLDRVGISSAPHHGSRHDSGSALWDALPNTRWVTIEASHRTGGTGNRHPHTQVLTELQQQGIGVHPATDDHPFTWRDKRIR